MCRPQLFPRMSTQVQPRVDPGRFQLTPGWPQLNTIWSGSWPGSWLEPRSWLRRQYLGPEKTYVTPSSVAKIASIWKSGLHISSVGWPGAGGTAAVAVGGSVVVFSSETPPDILAPYSAFMACMSSSANRKFASKAETEWKYMNYWFQNYWYL